MTLRKIARLGHPALLTPSAPIEDVHDPDLQALIEDMIETMTDALGVGLAAPQVHVNRRVIVAREIEAGGERDAGPVRVLVNPELAPIDAEIELAFEGCLSIPELRGLVPRRRRIGYRGLDRHGRAVAGTAQGLFARVLQHEVDHLDGVLYPMRMEDLRHLAFEGELRHLVRWMEESAEAGDE